jgi:hypothetical protein
MFAAAVLPSVNFVPGPYICYLWFESMRGSQGHVWT